MSTFKERSEAAKRASVQYGEEVVRDFLIAAGSSQNEINRLLAPVPDEPLGEHRVITFRAFGGYQYAAIRERGVWFFTQNGRTAPKPPMTWDRLLDHFGAASISSSIEVLK